MPDLSPLRLDALAADLDEAAPVAEVHAGVSLALAAGRTLLAEVQRIYAEDAADNAAADAALADPAEGERDDLAAKLDHLRASRTAVEVERDQLRAAVERLTAEVDGLRAEVRGLEEQARQDGAQLAELEAADCGHEHAPTVPDDYQRMADDPGWLTAWLDAHGLADDAPVAGVLRAVGRDLQGWTTGVPQGGRPADWYATDVETAATALAGADGSTCFGPLADDRQVEREAYRAAAGAVLDAVGYRKLVAAESRYRQLWLAGVGIRRMAPAQERYTAAQLRAKLREVGDAAERDQLRYERQLLGSARRILDQVAESEAVQSSDALLWTQAADLAQRIVDEISHPVSGEDALGPSLREQVATLTAELAETRAALDAERREHDQWAHDMGAATGEYQRKQAQRLAEVEQALNEARAETERLQPALAALQALAESETK